MALKVLMLRKEINSMRAELARLEGEESKIKLREDELEKAIEEAETEEERSTVEDAVDAHEQEKVANADQMTAIREKIAELEEQMREEEAKQENEPEKPEEKREERKEENKMETRQFFGMDSQERSAFFAREDVKGYLAEIRNCIREKRALNNVGAIIPEVFAGLLRQNIINYSKLYRHVNVQRIRGDGRAVIMGAVPEAVWMECCGVLNELTLGFNAVELDCYSVGGYFAVCNANIEDSDIDLAAELIRALAQSIGMALDKAILYGTGTRMPLGVVTRLLQTTDPGNANQYARTWVNLSTTNVQTISDDVDGIDLYTQIVIGSGAAKGAYSRGEKVWVMNETTYTALVAAGLSVNGSGAIVSGLNGTMPVAGGIVEVLNFVPDNVIIGGFFDLYILGERGGDRYATSEHVRFLQNQTVFRGVARYDGKPAIAEAFVVIGINGTTPTNSVTFAPVQEGEED